MASLRTEAVTLGRIFNAGYNAARRIGRLRPKLDIGIKALRNEARARSRVYGRNPYKWNEGFAAGRESLSKKR